MSTIIKLCFSNIKAKKFRSFLIILSVALSTALIYSILALSATTTDYFSKIMTKTTGETDIIATISQDESSPLTTALNPQIENPSLENVKTIVPVLEQFGYEENQDELLPVTFIGIDLNHFNSIFPKQIPTDIINSNNFQGNQIIITDKTATAKSLTIGDEYQVFVAGQLSSFKVLDIISDDNMLSYSHNMARVLLPQASSSNLLNTSNSASYYMIDLYDKSLVEETIENLSIQYPSLKFSESVSTDELINQLQMLQVPLALMAVSVLLVSCFIILSSFKIIIIERMPFLGTIRSLGSSSKKARQILYLESSFYSILGGFTGILFGMGILNMTLSSIFKGDTTNLTDFELFFPNYALIGLLTAFTIVFLSCLSPIRKISKRSIRSLLFKDVDSSSEFSIFRFIVGFIAIGSAFTLLNLDFGSFNLLLGFVSLIFVIIGVAMLVPTMTLLLSYPLSLIIKPLAGHHSKAAATQIKQDKTLLNNIILLTMGLGVILMVNNFSASVGELVTDIYGKAAFDVVLFNKVDEAFMTTAKETEGVTHVYGVRDIYDINANDESVTFPILEGIDGQGYFEYAWNEFGNQISTKDLETFEKERTIITTRLIANKYNLKEGDTVTLDLNGKKVNYTILKIVLSINNNGNMSYIHDSFFLEDTGISTYSSVYLETDTDPELVIKRIKKSYPYQMLYIMSLEQMKLDNQDGNDQMFGLLKAVSIIAMLIGVIGIFNNYVISFISRRQFSASLRSLGVNKRSLLKLFFTESMICGVIGSLGGMILGTLLIKTLAYILPLINIESSLVTYSAKEFIFIGIAGMLLATISSILPALSNVNRPIVAELKYE